MLAAQIPLRRATETGKVDAAEPSQQPMARHHGQQCVLTTRLPRALYQPTKPFVKRLLMWAFLRFRYCPYFHHPPRSCYLLPIPTRSFWVMQLLLLTLKKWPFQIP